MYVIPVVFQSKYKLYPYFTFGKAGRLEVGKCSSRGGSRGMYITFASAMRIRQPTLALKPRGDVTKNPKQGCQWPQKWTCIRQKLLKKKVEMLNPSRMMHRSHPSRYWTWLKCHSCTINLISKLVFFITFKHSKLRTSWYFIVNVQDLRMVVPFGFTV